MARSSFTRRLRVEALEDRRMLAVITVTSSVDDLVVDGMVTLREAIQAANTDSSVDGSIAGNGADTIELLPALSGQTITLGGTQLEITSALTIDASALAENVTIDANQLSRVILIDDPSTEDEDFDVSLAGLNIVNGNLFNDEFSITPSHGGGINSLTMGTLSLDSVLVSDNRIEAVIFSDGGGINALGHLEMFESEVSNNTNVGGVILGNHKGGGINAGSATLTNSVVTGNRVLAGGRGGGIRSETGTVTLNNSRVSGNSLVGRGGGINARNVFLFDSEVSDNEATYEGGGIRAWDATIFRSSIAKNSSGQGGGGIFVGFHLTVTESEVTDNTAFEGGGIWSLGGGGINGQEVLVIRSTIGSNTSTSEGGGIWTRCANIRLVQSTLSGNTGGRGGGASTRCGTMILSQSTVTGNHATNSGGGLDGFDSNYDTLPSIEGSIIAGNTADDSHPDIGGSSPELFAGLVNHSLIGDTSGSGIDATTGTGNLLNMDPMLGPLADNGGPILPSGNIMQTHALLPGSPAIDAGDPTIQQDPEQYDQRGDLFLRVADGDLLLVIAIDMGAYEAQASPSADFDSDHDIDGTDFLAWQRGYGITTGATKPDGNSDDDEDVDASDLAAWEVSFGDHTAPPRLEVNGQSSAPLSQQAVAATPTMLDLPAELVDAVIAMDQSMRSGIGDRSVSAALSGEDRFDRVPRRARWAQPTAWHGRSEIAEHSLLSRANDDRFHRHTDDTVDEELLDGLFAEDELVSLL